jgi:hypothetical protein
MSSGNNGPKGKWFAAAKTADYLDVAPDGDLPI